jgi:hypothetical protein
MGDWIVGEIESVITVSHENMRYILLQQAAASRQPHIVNIIIQIIIFQNITYSN